MPLFILRNQKIRSTNWRVGERMVRFDDRIQLIDLLRFVQSSRNKAPEPLRLAEGGGALDATYHLTIAPLGRPKVFEYQILNSAGGCCCTINGVIGYSDASTGSRGVVVARTSRGEIIGRCDYTRCEATMEVSGDSVPLYCSWSESTAGHKVASGMVYGDGSRSKTELCTIVGQTREEELGGSTVKYQVLSDGKLLAEIYPEGEWKYDPLHLWRRLVRDTIPLVRYSDHLHRYVGDKGTLAEQVIVATVCLSVALPRPIRPADNPP